ncbi:divalent-cation tolerance protein CutA [Pelagicoccus sp. SDUM812003]|uniref:divalent-cation tolerance protein CutA n=1 Tax=Pelagicoccus sp. SDUM812003 TaxID=3041267 RepID=UPI00280EEA29|nr:divalent-cation tolerance protein CutA [Pelagicoccus sp. SDUM812003]MDQ8205433.1 divalent-cation tolerance protein CutA [Pelagicoccus sp. SDUM812003]
MPESDTSLFVCWTTAPDREIAQKLASLAIEKGAAACAQIDGPINSVYLWKDQVETDQEFRLWFKTTRRCLDALEELVAENHPYDTPQWVCLKAEKVSEKYLKWAGDVANLRGFA